MTFKNENDLHIHHGRVHTGMHIFLIAHDVAHVIEVTSYMDIASDVAHAIVVMSYINVLNV